MPEPEIVTHKGKPVSVIIPIKDYRELLERVEDADDVAWLKRAPQTVALPTAGGLSRRAEPEAMTYRVMLERGAEKDLARLSPEIYDRALALAASLFVDSR